MAKAVIVKMPGSEPHRYVPEEGTHLAIVPKEGCIVIEQRRSLNPVVKLHTKVAVLSGTAHATYED